MHARQQRLVYRALCKISVEQTVNPEGFAVGGKLLAVIESVVHELCHWVTLGYTLPYYGGVAMETIIGRLVGRIRADVNYSNKNEIRTIGAEIVVMRALDIGWNITHDERLYKYALSGLVIDDLGHDKRIKRIRRYRDAMESESSKRRAKLAANQVLAEIRRNIEIVQ